MKKFEALVSVISPTAGGWRVSMAVSILFTVHGTEDSQHKTEIIIVGHLSTLCLPDVTACDQISQAFPLRRFYCKYWRWERSYTCSLYTA